MAEIIRPPFTLESAAAKVKVAEDLWNTRDPERVQIATSERRISMPGKEW